MGDAPREARPVHHADAEGCVDAVLATVGKEIVLALPLGLGKAYQFANALYRRVAHDPSLKLTIFTALTLHKPVPSGELERRFLEPITERLFDGCPELAYARARREGSLPANVRIHEFFFQTADLLGSPAAQQDYISANYTHAMRELLDRGVNVLGQLVARRGRNGETRYSLSCNPDLTLDLLQPLERWRRAGTPIALVAEVNDNLPYMAGDAEVEPAVFDHVIESKTTHCRLFSSPKRPVSTADYVAGLHVASLIRDCGTLQLGIGSIGDAVTYALKLRHEQNTRFQELMEVLVRPQAQRAAMFEDGVFEHGLYGASEMFVEGFLELWRAGVLRRRVYGDARVQALLNEGLIEEAVTPETLHTLYDAGAIGSPLSAADLVFLKRFGVIRDDVALCGGGLVTGCGRQVPAVLDDPAERARIAEACLGTRLKGGVLLHAAFFIGTQAFHEALKALSDEDRAAFAMTAVSFTNTLYGDEQLKVAQRRHARFVNNAMMATLLGAVVADALEDGRVVSGVGGQYEFVAMAHRLEDARAIVVLNSTRQQNGRVTSNIVWNYGHATIPRHLRDIVVTEYGVADLRGRSDREVIAAMLNVADSSFQAELLEQAKAAGKIEKDYAVPASFRENTPERLRAALCPARRTGLLPDFPFGSDFTEVEADLARVLKGLAKETTRLTQYVRAVTAALRERSPARDELPHLERLRLDTPHGVKERLLQKLVLHAVRSRQES
jgi:acyl-CoA hydrolase